MSRAPVHIMRFAPADYLLDAFVKDCYRRRDHRTLAFYTGFLFTSHLEGGSLPADPTRLAAHLGMAVSDVTPALTRCVEAEKLRVKDGRVYHKRVASEVADELAYRDQQSEFGKLGGRPRKPPIDDDAGKGPLSGGESPPAPPPAPGPAPAPNASTPASALAVGEPDDFASEEVRDECKALLKRVVQEAGSDGQVALTRASRTPNGRVIVSLDAPKLTTAWVRNTTRRLAEMLLSHQADEAPSARASPALTEKAQTRRAAIDASFVASIKGDGTLGGKRD